MSNAFEGTVTFHAEDKRSKMITDYKVSCVYQYDGTAAVLSYVEPKQPENDNPTRVRVCFESDKVTTIRSGDISGVFPVSLKEPECTVQIFSSLGPIDLALKTEELEFEYSDGGATVDMKYLLLSSGKLFMKNIIHFEVTENKTEKTE